MPLRRQNAIEGDEGADALSDAFLRLQEALHGREQNVQEVLRRFEESAAAALQAALGQVEQKLQQRDEAIRGLEARVRALEGRMSAAEGRLAPFTERGGAQDAGDGKSLEQLEHRMANLEASIRRALASVFPRVESLVEKLEKSPPGATGTPSAAPAAPSLSRSSCSFSVAPASGTDRSSSHAETRVGAPEGHNRSPGEADGEEEREKQEVMARMQEIKARRIKARMSPALLGEKLCRAAFLGRLEDVRRLTNTETYINYIDKEGDSPLISALLSKAPNARVVSLLLERGADVNAINDQGRAAIHYAAACDSTGRSVRLLIGAGADVDARDGTGATPLHWAAFNGNETAVRALLAAGAKSYRSGWSEEWTGKTPFDVATSDGVRMLLRQ
ncbi:hypothetical protein R5R35_004556 [Gryllus longicercus]|uniref:Ankyrin repeat-containing protein n=1 Tax=Gryllus longicercus TaxID=2509291 RepID=A0AAN9ZDD0_9ORTH